MGKTVAEMNNMDPERVVELAQEVKELCQNLTDVTEIPHLLSEYADREGLPTSEIIFLGMTAENILATHRKLQVLSDERQANEKRELIRYPEAKNER